ncbi:MAG: Coenzyme F420 hydrogenase/dehydrogenase, beta subunit C-terminal domain [Desulfurococcaceae archaeon]
MHIARPKSWSKVCCGCAACSLICPSGVKMEFSLETGIFNPVLEGECSNCELCIKICPLRNIFSENNSISLENLIGKYMRIYLGYARDNGIRIRASSGGVATALLIHMLNSRVIDGAVAVSMNRYFAKPVFVKSIDEVLETTGSKYVQVPLLEVFKNIPRDTEKIAVVGLPCHIRALTLLKKTVSDLDKKIYVSIGLFCSRTINYYGLEALIKKIGVRDFKDVVEIKFRTGGWPGYLRVKLESGRVISIPYFKYWRPLFSTYFFTPLSCLLCSDLFNEYSDISLGDPWIPEILRSESRGLSIIVTRSTIGEEIVRKAVEDGYIEIVEADQDTLLESQWYSILFKKIIKPSMRELLGLDSRDSLSNPLLRLITYIQLVNATYSYKTFYRDLIMRTPTFFLEAYAFLVSRIGRICWRMIRSEIENPHHK